jgi:beta-adrenergic-receptor kinase
LLLFADLIMTLVILLIHNSSIAYILCFCTWPNTLIDTPLACKKGTSGKLYAMKTMEKKRIKMKKSEQLAISEREALAAVQSPFVVNLKYALHCADDVYLILEMMTGGDLGYHLHRKGNFQKKECMYYAARIMLALQALHDKEYVFRDLKPENCLLADDGRVKITDLGLATKITSKLIGAAGTRGYWAPEMLRRDSKGKRVVYGHTVDWFSFGCCLAEFISGTNPFRSEAAKNFGAEHGKTEKEKQYDHATLEMDPEFPPAIFEPEAVDLCRKLLDKNEKTRLGYKGCKEIMSHPWFNGVRWEDIISDKERPPFVPPKEVNAMSQPEIGSFSEDKIYQETVLTSEDEEFYKDWDWTNPRAFAAEVVEFLIQERINGTPLIPLSEHNPGCCDIL